MIHGRPRGPQLLTNNTWLFILRQRLPAPSVLPPWPYKGVNAHTHTTEMMNPQYDLLDREKSAWYNHRYVRARLIKTSVTRREPGPSKGVLPSGSLAHQKVRYPAGAWLIKRCVTHRKSLPSNLRALVNRTVRAGMLMPMAKVSVANKACGERIMSHSAYLLLLKHKARPSGYSLFTLQS